MKLTGIRKSIANLRQHFTKIIIVLPIVWYYSIYCLSYTALGVSFEHGFSSVSSRLCTGPCRHSLGSSCPVLRERRHTWQTVRCSDTVSGWTKPGSSEHHFKIIITSDLKGANWMQILNAYWHGLIMLLKSMYKIDMSDFTRRSQQQTKFILWSLNYKTKSTSTFPTACCFYRLPPSCH